MRRLRGWSVSRERTLRKTSGQQSAKLRRRALLILQNPYSSVRFQSPSPTHSKAEKGAGKEGWVVSGETCDLKSFFAATRSNSLPLAYETLRVLSLQLSAITKFWKLTLPKVQNGS